jgi:hypothetical protein
MAGGIVPVIFNAGGHKEIVINKECGFLWNREYELLRITKLLIADKSLLRRISLASISESSKFSYQKFELGVNKLV